MGAHRRHRSLHWAFWRQPKVSAGEYTKLRQRHDALRDRYEKLRDEYRSVIDSTLASVLAASPGTAPAQFPEPEPEKVPVSSAEDTALFSTEELLEALDLSEEDEGEDTDEEDTTADAERDGADTVAALGMLVTAGPAAGPDGEDGEGHDRAE